MSEKAARHMRPIALLFALMLACPAAAEEWKEYDSPD
jgi:hypothetical protein